MYPQQQSFFVLGLSRSGFAAAQYLLKQGATVYIYDDVDAGIVRQNKQTLVKLGARLVEKGAVSKMPQVCDALVLSPGIAIDHPIPVAFRRAKKGVIGESELAIRVLSVPFIAVTGTNGKTTTVSMISEMIQGAGHRAFSCGNIGAPIINLVDQTPPFFAVTEISSFQLETLNSYCPHIAVILNITQDHLNRHYNMENYLFLKGKLLKNLTETEYAVLNYDDENVRNLAEKTKAKVVYFSLRGKVDGAYFDGKNLCYGEENIMPAEKMLVGGLHNIQNALATICVGKLLGIDNINIAKSLEIFKGARHRIEEIAVVDGVRFVDDSKATNADATVKAVRCMKDETILLLGGKDKNQDYADLFKAVADSKVVHTVLYGENRFRLIDAAEKSGWTKVTLCTGFDCAVRFARMLSSAGQTVLLSPASASFDEFTDYEERGDRFVAIVGEFAGEQQIEHTKKSDEADGLILPESIEEMEE